MSIARKIGNLGTALDSAALSTFLSKGTTDGEFDTIAWGDVTGKPSYIDSSLATQLFDSAYVQARQSAVSSGGLDSAAVTSLIDSNYVAARATAATSSGFVMYNYNATSGQTAFQDSDTAGNVLSYTADGILVYYNGLLLADEDYTATDGSAVTLTEGADSGAQITIGKWNLTGSGSSGGAAVWYGDRAVIGGGKGGINNSSIEYFDISTPGNSSNFGSLTAGREHLDATSDNTYVLFAGASNSQSSYQDVIDYVTAATTSNASDFGDLAQAGYHIAAASDGTYAYFCGGFTPSSNEYSGIDYLTIQTTSNASSFGYLTIARGPTHGAMGTNNTIVVAGGNYNTSPYNLNTIDYFTAGTPTNASDFGDLTQITYEASAANDDTYGVVFLNKGVNVIDYITIATPGNATDFGDLTATVTSSCACENSTYACNTGGSIVTTIDYITIATPSNASDFGDLQGGRYRHGAGSASPS